MKSFVTTTLQFAAVLSLAICFFLSFHYPVGYFSVHGTLAPTMQPYPDWKVAASAAAISTDLAAPQLEDVIHDGSFTASLYAPITGPAYLYVWKDGYIKERITLPLGAAQNGQIVLPRPLDLELEKIKSIPTARTTAATTVVREVASPRLALIYDRNQELIERLSAEQVSFYECYSPPQAHPTNGSRKYGTIGILRGNKVVEYENKFFEFTDADPGLQYTRRD